MFLLGALSWIHFWSFTSYDWFHRCIIFIENYYFLIYQSNVILTPGWEFLLCNLTGSSIQQDCVNIKLGFFLIIVGGNKKVTIIGEFIIHTCLDKGVISHQRLPRSALSKYPASCRITSFFFFLVRCSGWELESWTPIKQAGFSLLSVLMMRRSI